LLWQIDGGCGLALFVHGIWGFGGGLALQLHIVMANFFVLYLWLWRISAPQPLGMRFSCNLSLGYFLVAVWLWLVAYPVFRMLNCAFGLF
jgi:hypothetical protein